MLYYGMCNSVIMYLRDYRGFILVFKYMLLSQCMVPLYNSKQATTLYINCNVSAIQF